MGGLEARGKDSIETYLITGLTETFGTDFVTTPPLPSSSPAPLTELMEVSPLPHKTPFFTHIEITSPTPGSTPCDDEMMLDSPAPITRQSSLEPPKPIVAESV